MADNVLEIRDLAVDFKTEIGVTHALRDIGFDVPRGEATAIVGESGSGKSVTANCIMRLIEPPGAITSGRIDFSPTGTSPFDIVSLPDKDPQKYPGRRLASLEG